jgi:hypothetical protein
VRFACEPSRPNISIPTQEGAARCVSSPLSSALSFALVAPAAAQPVGIDDVRAMAFDKGMVNIKEVELDDGIWEVKGYDATGHKLKMEVEAWSGAIVKLKRND